MSEKTARYELLKQQARALLTSECDLVANMSNLASLVFNELPQLNGTSFYRFKDNELILGPFQGKPACMHIAVGKGVCGTVAKTQKAEVVPNVHKFSGHIACDSASKSEVVVPVFKNGKFWGVFDLDSPEYNTFDDVDANYLSEIAPIVFGVQAEVGGSILNDRRYQ
ncbi:GAF domain-containing protein [Lactiplantibacillus plantarum]|uniref:GAF domain-containing protein n=1 Tax=Lactiplantibacillus plantarum TaxID=1590 RepID=UPI0007BC1C15|nr:GAF domain-containing protein [Lactiplantibacillus plantarum]KZU08045.1 Free methionine--sulfoxide reductase contains GAF domain [Lactiplantibacillus plantarum]KZU86439.1 Free methionine--sulfoxide reductase contains GAF domain [Lactiplantibacillus plantarum]MCW6152446.1 GAF domain-containing protein [Lactiplantibacillus plantarum]